MSAAPLSPACQSPEFTTTSPVIAQTTTVSQKVPVEETSACRTGFFVCAAAATMGALPRPDSFEKRPRATPNRIASFIPAPRNPPRAAWPLKALDRIRRKVAGRVSACATRR